jgi:hypothetical protein
MRKILRKKVFLSVALSLIVFSIQAQTVVVSHDFNTSADGWIETTTTSGNWVNGNAILNSGSDGTFMHTSPTTYSNSAIIVIESPTLDLSSRTELVLSIDVRYDSEADYDGFKVEYSSNNGVAWSDLGAVGDGSNWYNDTDVDGIATNADGWSGDNETWQTAIVNLPVALENNATVKFRVRFASDVGLTDVGVAFDNFIITSGGTEIYISGNGVEIKDGDTTPTADDDTDFRSVDIASGFKIKEYTILNTSGGTLNLTGASPVSLSGTHSADYSIEAQPASLILAGGESTTFSIKFNPSAAGKRTATISVASDDADEDPYNFSIEGSGVNAVIIHNFNAGVEGWAVQTATNGSWSRGTAVLSEGADGSFWYTTPSTGYNNDAILVMESPVIDLTGETEIILYLDIRYDSETDWDGFKLQYSADGGTNYLDLGVVGDGINWYNDTDVDGIANGADGWAGHNGKWETAEIELPVALENNATTRFRVRFQSDASTTDLAVAFDNFMISAGIPEIYVSGNSSEILNGETTLSNLAYTDFRNVDITSGTKSNSFEIKNLGGGTLNLDGVPIVAISGTNAADFTVTTQPASIALAFVETTTFTIAFDPSATGDRTATVSIANDDADDDPYTFSIGGTGDNAVFFHDFNSDGNGWTNTGTTNWLNGNAIHSTGADGNFWHTDASPYGNDASLILQSPVLDLTGETNLSLHIDLRYDTEADFDGFKIEYSDDGGTTWYDLGQHLDDLNWYNDTDLDAFAAGEDGWSGDNGAWQTSELDLPAVLEGNANARFRILFASDANTTAVGVAIDNFSIYGDVVPLPVELLSFEGALNGTNIDLSWATASEENNDFFEIQRSSNGKDFYTLGQVSGNGTVNERRYYHYVDRNPEMGVNFYRLKQVDFDGQFEIHKTIGIDQASSTARFEVVLRPNPSKFTNRFEISVLSDDTTRPLSVRLMSISGAVFFDEVIDNGVNTKLSLVPYASLGTGIYVLSVIQGNQRSVSKLIVD